jgi:hypothetical protein
MLPEFKTLFAELKLDTELLENYADKAYAIYEKDLQELGDE